jgi:hypothetical protein
MEDALYKETLERAKEDLLKSQKELGECLEKQEALEKQITELRRIIVPISRMLGEEFVEEDAMGLTDAIRQAFKSDGRLTPMDVKGALKQIGYDLSQYGNFMASVHAVINRLAARGEIRQTGTIDGKPAYEWVVR